MTIAGATIFRLKTDHLDQLLATSVHDGALQRALDDSADFIERSLGYAFPAVAGAGTVVIYGANSTFLRLPPHTLTVTSVTAPSGYSVPGYYVNTGGYLRVTDSSGALTPLSSYGLTYERWYYHSVWQYGVPYTITGTFDAAPGEIVRLCLELAVQLWKFRDAGGSDTVGGEGTPIVQVRNQLTTRQREVLDAYRLGGPSAGVS